MKFFRGKTGQRLFRVVVWITLASLAGLTSIVGLFKRFYDTGNAAAYVNGYEIDMRTLMRRTHEEEQRRLYLRQQLGESAAILMQDLGKPRDQAMKQLVQEKLLLSVADKLIPAISKETIAAKIHDPIFLIQAFGDMLSYDIFDELGGVNVQRLMHHLERNGILAADFEEAVKEAIQRTQLLSLIQGSYYVPRTILQDRYNKEHAKKRFLVAEFPIEAQVKKVRQAGIDQDGVKKYFDAQNSANRKYWTPEERSGKAWYFDADSYTVPVSEKEMRDYYQRFKCRFELKPEKKDKDGVVVQEAVIKPFDSVKQEIRQTIALEKFPKVFAADAARVIAQSQDNPDLFSSFVAQKNGRLKPFDGIQQDYSQSFNTKIFELGLNKRGAGIMQKNDNKIGFIAELGSIAPRKALVFSDIKNQVTQDYELSLAESALENVLEKARLLDADALKILAKQEGGRAAITSILDPRDQKSAESIKQDGLAVDRMMRMSKKGQTIASAGEHKSFVVKLVEIEPIDDQKLAELKKELSKNLWMELNQPVIMSFIASLQKGATIKNTQQYSQDL